MSAFRQLLQQDFKVLSVLEHSTEEEHLLGHFTLKKKIHIISFLTIFLFVWKWLQIFILLKSDWRTGVAGLHDAPYCIIGIHKVELTK